MSEEFTISREFDAPRELVFKAWTEAERLAKWWGPKGCACEVKALDLRPGGLFHYRLHWTAGQEMWGKFVYREIAPPERLVFVTSFSDAAGGTTRAPFSENWPREELNVATFTERDGKTTVTLRGGPVNPTEEERKLYAGMHDSMRGGFGGTFDQLDAYLATA